MNIPQIEFPNSDSEFIKNPYPYLKELRESSSLHLDTLSDLALITRFEDVKNVQTNKFFSSADPEEIENPNRNEEEHEYFWKTEKQSKNVQRIIDLANKVSAQSVEIYDSAQSAHDSVEKSMQKLEAVMSKIKDGRGSLLSRILKMIKVGGLSPKKELPNNVKEEVDQDEDDEKDDEDKND